MSEQRREKRERWGEKKKERERGREIGFLSPFLPPFLSLSHTLSLSVIAFLSFYVTRSYPFSLTLLHSFTSQFSHLSFSRFFSPPHSGSLFLSCLPPSKSLSFSLSLSVSSLPLTSVSLFISLRFCSQRNKRSEY